MKTLFIFFAAWISPDMTELRHTEPLLFHHPSACIHHQHTVAQTHGDRVLINECTPVQVPVSVENAPAAVDEEPV